MAMRTMFWLAAVWVSFLIPVMVTRDSAIVRRCKDGVPSLEFWTRKGTPWADIGANAPRACSFPNAATIGLSRSVVRVLPRAAKKCIFALSPKPKRFPSKVRRLFEEGEAFSDGFWLSHAELAWLQSGVQIPNGAHRACHEQIRSM